MIAEGVILATTDHSLGGIGLHRMTMTDREEETVSTIEALPAMTIELLLVTMTGRLLAMTRRSLPAMMIGCLLVTMTEPLLAMMIAARLVMTIGPLLEGMRTTEEDTLLAK